MHHFDYKNGALYAEGVAVTDIVKAAGSPVYIYSVATVARHYTGLADALRTSLGKTTAHIYYAMKANSNIGVLATLAKLGAGADVVSEGEIRKALRAGIPASRIVFSGVGKTEAELEYAVKAGLYQINIESEGELLLLNQVAQRLGKAQAAVFRVNPDIGAGGHAKITTGGKANKFGVSFEETARLYALAATMPGIAMKGIALHIGSQITEFSALEAAFMKIRGLVNALRHEGHIVERLDLGGGIGIPYEMEPPFHHGPGILTDYAAMIARVTNGLNVELGFEPGRMIVGNAGILVTRSLYVNARSDMRFLVLDAAMNDLMRPSLYDAYHAIWPVMEATKATKRHKYDVVGPICETGDTFARDRLLPEMQHGDLLAFMTAGAYGATMASTYNLRPLIAEVIVSGDTFSITRPRQNYDDLINMDVMPSWI